MSAAQKILSEPAPLAESDPAIIESEMRDAPHTVRRALEAYNRLGIPYSLSKLDSAPSTPEALAEALATEIDYIVLSTMYRGKATRKPVLLLHSAATRVSDKLLCQLVGENVQRADGDFIMRQTGFTADGLPPVAHLNRVPLILDSSLTRLARVWCNAGEPGYYVSTPTLVLARAISARLVRLST